jgi:hypothetical protein
VYTLPRLGLIGIEKMPTFVTAEITPTATSRVLNLTHTQHGHSVSGTVSAKRSQIQRNTSG